MVNADALETSIADAIKDPSKIDSLINEILDPDLGPLLEGDHTKDAIKGNMGKAEGDLQHSYADR